MRLIILAGTVRIPEGKRESLLPLIDKMIASTRAEPGCIDYAFSFDVRDEHLIHIFEVFADSGALAAHRASPHMAEWRARGSELGVHDRNIREYLVSAARSI